MNNSNLSGRVVRDPEVVLITSTNPPTELVKFTLAVDRPMSSENKQKASDVGRKTADFIPCYATGMRGQFIKAYIRQGSAISVEGRIQSYDYTKQDGGKAYGLEVKVTNVEFQQSQPKTTNAKPTAPAIMPQTQPMQANSLTPEQVQAMLAMMGQTQMAQSAVQQTAPQPPSVPVAVQPPMPVVQTPQMAVATPSATTQATPLGFDAPVFS